MPNTAVLLYIAAVYNRPFSSFSPSFEHPPEFSPRTPKVEAGLLSATSKSASNSTWCTKPIDDLPSNARCEHLKYLHYFAIPLPHLLTPLYWPVRNHEEGTKPRQKARDTTPSLFPLRRNQSNSSMHKVGCSGISCSTAWMKLHCRKDARKKNFLFGRFVGMHMY